MSISDRRLDELASRAAQPDASIDFSEIPELDETFFETATLVEPDRTEHVTSRMSAVLETSAKAKLTPR